MPDARLHDGSTIEIEMCGEGPALLLPVNPHPVEGELAEQMRQYGNDPALGRSLIEGLSDIVRVVAFDYEGQVLRVPKPRTLTPDTVARDMLAVADAAHVEQFAYYGYSWLALVGLQLAIRTDRLSALMMGGFPPLHGPYAEMLRITTAANMRATNGSDSTQTGQEATGASAEDEDEDEDEDEWSGSGLSKDQTQQFVTLYQALQGFDDRAAQARIRCPRLCFVGSADEIEYGKNWGDVRVSLAGPVVRERAHLEKLGWDVRVLDGLDHIQAMQAPQVVPLLRSWLASKVSSLPPA